MECSICCVILYMQRTQTLFFYAKNGRTRKEPTGFPFKIFDLKNFCHKHENHLTISITYVGAVTYCK